MKKYLPYLEQYVQWIALGLGALFVFWMVYAYVLTPPVTQTVGSTKVDLGDIDHVTREGPAKDLDTAIQTGASPDAIQKIKVQPLLPQFQKEISGAGDVVSATPLPTYNWDAPTAPPFATGLASAPHPGLIGPNGIAEAPPQVNDLNPPAALFIGMSVGRSSVTPPPPPTNPVAAAPGAAPAAPALQAAQPIQPIQAAALAAAPANAANPNNQPTIDKNWVSIHYKIPSAALADSFKKAGVPAVRNATSFLRVELTRQEQLPDGKWGNETIVPPLAIAFLNAPPWPDPKAAPAPLDEQTYLTWAQANVQAILQPIFYTVIKGDLPGVPGDPLQHVGMPVAPVKAFDPAHPGPPPYTPEQQAAIAAYRAQLRATHTPTRTPTRAPAPRTPNKSPGRGGARGGVGGAGGGDAAFAPYDNERPTVLAQIRPPNRVIGAGGDAGPEDMVDGGAAAGGAGIQQTNNDALNKLSQTLPQTSPFDPSQLTIDVDVIAYDENPEPGKTYRYQMRYYVQNPVYNAAALVKNAAMAQKFALPSLPADWTPPADVPATVNFFLASGGINGDSVKLDIYRWQNGDVNKISQNVVPGDHIGMTSKDGIDFNTKWTVVDVRNGNGDRYVIVQDDQGNIARREFKLDQNNPLHKDLDAQATAAAAVAAAAAQAAAAANPNAPGNPPR
ncbi:MAG TPA: hypothetical protein VFE58_11495 [Tepidisphaeraceae bacterium]|jgi:hypothetical protein|nr:hypothetical protein [Tepidisphaeraceae bacterium]